VVTAILRLPAVKARTGLSRSTIYLRISEGSFPKPISLGGRAVGWIDSEVDAWLAERVAESRDATAHRSEPIRWSGNPQPEPPGDETRRKPAPRPRTEPGGRKSRNANGRATSAPRATVNQSA